MKITKKLASIEDFFEILNLIEDGKEQMKAKGVMQWDENYPNSSVIKKDIQQRTLWLYGEKKQACVTVKMKGNTVDIHRLVVNSLYKEQGLAKLILQDILDWASINKHIKQVKITTNHTNQSMLKLLLAKEFVPIRSFKIEGRTNYGSFIELSRELQSKKNGAYDTIKIIILNITCKG